MVKRPIFGPARPGKSILSKRVKVVRGIYGWLRKVRFGEPIIIVSGLPRSGTSMAMKMLDAAGVPVVTDGAREADIDNPKGYFEDDRVLHLAKDGDKSWLREARGKAIKIISYLVRHLPADNNYRVVFMVREIDEVLASQAKMLERRGEENNGDDQQMRTLFESDLWRTRYFIKNNHHVESLELTYHEVLAQPLDQAQRLASFLDANLDVDAMAAVVDPSLYRNRVS